jgi:RNA polymerase sigma-70 factor (ECF subfamily)
LTELVEQARSGQPLALDRLLIRLHPRLAARVERRLPPDVRAVFSTDDILQDVYSDAFRNIAQFSVRESQDAGESFFRWLATIADHRVVDAVRSQRAAKRGGNRQFHVGGSPPVQSSIAPLVELLAGEGQTPSRDARGHELEEAIHAAIAGLYPAYREALELRYLLDLSPAQVAARMGRTEDAVHKLCGRAIGALREAIGDAGRFTSRE